MKTYKMKQRKSKLGIILTLILIVGGMLTCQFSEPTEKPSVPNMDTTVYNAWMREKTQLMNTYDQALVTLSATQDSLKRTIGEKKSLLRSARYAWKQTQTYVTTRINDADSCIAPATVKSLLDSLILSCEQNHQACDRTIVTLDSLLVSKDESINLLSSKVGVMEKICDQQDLQITHYKIQLEDEASRRKTLQRKCKLLSTGLLLVAGAASAFLMTQSLR